MTDVKQSGVVFSIPQLDSISSSWEINNRTGAVRVKAPKTGLEENAYPDYDKYADKTAKSICRVLRRKLPRSNSQRKKGGKIAKTGRTPRDLSESRSKKKERETPEKQGDSATESEENSNSESEINSSEAESEAEESKHRNKRKSSSRRGFMDKSVRRKAKQLGHRILDDPDSEDSANDIVTESDYRKFRHNMGDKDDRRKKSKRRNKASSRIQPLDSETDSDTESEQDSEHGAQNSRNRNRRRTVKSATRKRTSKRLQSGSSDDESESPAAKFRRRKRTGNSKHKGKFSFIEPSEPEPKKSKRGAESGDKSESEGSRETPDLEHFWR